MQNHVRDERRRGNGVGELLLCGFSLFPALFFAAVEHSGLFRVLNHPVPCVLAALLCTTKQQDSIWLF